MKLLRLSLLICTAIMTSAQAMEKESLLDFLPKELRKELDKFIENKAIINFWLIKASKKTSMKIDFNGPIFSVNWSPDGNKIVSGTIDAAHIWDAKTGALIRVLPTSSLTFVSWNHDGTKIATSSWDGVIRIWDAITGNLLRTLANGSQVSDTSWSPDDTKIVSGSRDSIKVWDISNGNIIYTFPGQHILSVAWSPDGQKIAAGSYASNDKTIKIYDTQTGSLIKTISYDSRISKVSWSHRDNIVIAGASNNTCLLFDISTMQQLSGNYGGICELGPDDLIMAAITDTTLNLWVLSWLAGELDHSGIKRIYSFAWSPEGSRIVTGSIPYDAPLPPPQQRGRIKQLLYKAAEAIVGRPTIKVWTVIDPEIKRTLYNNQEQLSAYTMEILIKAFDAAQNKIPLIVSEKELAFLPPEIQKAIKENVKKIEYTD